MSLRANPTIVSPLTLEIIIMKPAVKKIKVKKKKRYIRRYTKVSCCNISWKISQLRLSTNIKKITIRIR